ncbi:hypothetical protein [Lactobacillus sp.]|uniref:hypothetical protein n=1 Tax=Lactobacillus sp. TaxID=1591 RepID=UPI0019A4C76F|nr:hypothetical protein [Lactobacillus sp.]MBD5430143.1 hypothetical protein [Lactobacillus sp.]
MANFNNPKTGYIDPPYDSGDLSLVINGVLMFDFASGSTAVEYADDNAVASSTVDLQGAANISINHKGTGKLTVNLSQMSPCNKVLTDLLDQRKIFSIDYRNSDSHVYSEHCYIEKHPNVTTAETAGTSAWLIVVLDRTIESLLGDS